MSRQTALFAFATLLPAGLIGIGAVQGGPWVLAAVLVLTLVTSLADRLLPEDRSRDEDATGTALAVVLALAHLALVPLVVWALAGDAISRLEKVGLFFAAGLYFGQVSNANAHELIHRPQRVLHRLGMWVYISLLFGHHTSAHVLVHHRHVATRQDPNTSRKGEGFYRYMIRAWAGSFKGGYRAEKDRLARIGRAAWRNPYWVYLGGGAGFIALAYLLGGAKGMVLYIALAGHAQMQLLLSDYVQHYGLTRKTRADGKAEPVAARHSWNSPHLYSSAMMLNATRHSDHHARPARVYPALELPPDAPVLPRPLPLMASIALVPPLWRRIMDPLADRWRDA
ncbi:MULTISPECIES: alkane 1-monooxygenase [unclassified Yoonia]|uniref:alkane 1-monooxygenase n=1 Tax=unclassified Yoonia TaxID=2629118 RepID=UPI002AFE5AC7|nr:MULTISPECIES: alkane 1-monooxygenase [unclassified Yoonia]